MGMVENEPTQPARSVPTMYGAVYAAIDESVARLTCLPHSEAAVQRALACARSDPAEAAARAQLESMSIALQSLKLSTYAKDASGRIAATEQLRVAADSWLRGLPLHS